MSTGMVRRYNDPAVIWNSEVSQKKGQGSNLDSFLQEARKLAKVEAIPCVVNVRDLFSQNNTAYIVMDYIEGETLAQKLQREGPMPFAECVSVLMPIIQALEQVHRLGIIHRDISPDNIMLQPNGKLMLLDLGAAKEIDIQKKDGSIQSSRLVAKDGFSPLEQYSSDGRVGTWTDVYSMSATIYYCCTGKLPPRATERTGTDPLVCCPPLKEKEFAVLKQGMAINGKDRIQTIGELLGQLQALTKGPRGGNSAVNREGDDHPTPGPFPPLSNGPVAAVLFGAEAMVFLCMAYVLETVDSVQLFRIAGCLLSVCALARTKPSRKLFCAGCVSLCLAYGLTYSLAGWVGAAAMLSVPVLLLSEQLGIPDSREWPEKYWFIPNAVHCVYLIMYCVESFQLLFLILDAIAGCALALAMRGFVPQNSAAKGQS